MQDEFGAYLKCGRLEHRFLRVRCEDGHAEKLAFSFPQHPHRGFETVTFVREGFIDHSDSLGATARFGRGDVQWLTAGAGIVHSDSLPGPPNAAPRSLATFEAFKVCGGQVHVVEAIFEGMPPNAPSVGVEERRECEPLRRAHYRWARAGLA